MPGKVKSRRGAPWKLREHKLLGKVPDSAIVQRWRRSIKEVVAKRERCGIALETGPRRWTPDKEKLLGQRPDEELAHLWRCTVGQVKARRQTLHIHMSSGNAGDRKG